MYRMLSSKFLKLILMTPIFVAWTLSISPYFFFKFITNSLCLASDGIWLNKLILNFSPSLVDYHQFVLLDKKKSEEPDVSLFISFHLIPFFFIRVWRIIDCPNTRLVTTFNQCTNPMNLFFFYRFWEAQNVK